MISTDTGLMLMSFFFALAFGKFVMSIFTCIVEKRMLTWGETLKDVAFYILSVIIGIGCVLITI